MKSIELQFWLASHNIKLFIKRRDLTKSITGASRFYTEKSHLVEIIKDGILISATGNGETKAKALRDFAGKISGAQIMIGGYNGYRVYAPKLIVKNIKGIE